MSLKNLSKTRWKIEPNRVTVYPYGVFYIFTIIVAIIFAGLLFVYFNYEKSGIANALPIVLLFALMVMFFWGFAYTYIEFDSRVGRMRKMLMGFLPVKTIPFTKLQGINPVSNVAGSYNYRLFRKDARYGKGIIVSSGYTKTTTLMPLLLWKKQCRSYTVFSTCMIRLTQPKRLNRSVRTNISTKTATSTH